MAKRGNPIKATLPSTGIRQEFYIDCNNVNLLNQIATNTGTTKSDVVRRALDLWFAQNPIDEFIKNNPKPSKKRSKNLLKFSKENKD